MKKELTWWQAFEVANKYYVIYMGALWVTAALALLFFTAFLDVHSSERNLIIGMVFLLAGVIVLFLGVKSKVSGLEES